MSEREEIDIAGQPEWLTTGDMARLSQTTLRTVRFYEAEGLIASMARRRGDHRRFHVSELYKLQAISDLREAGLSLQQIRELMEIKEGSRSPSAATCALTQALGAHLEQLQKRVATLQRVHGELCSTLEDIRPCGDCATPNFPEACCDCDRMNGPQLAHATHLLWKN